MIFDLFKRDKKPFDPESLDDIPSCEECGCFLHIDNIRIVKEFMPICELGLDNIGILFKRHNYCGRCKPFYDEIYPGCKGIGCNFRETKYYVRMPNGSLINFRESNEGTNTK